MSSPSSALQCIGVRLGVPACGAGPHVSTSTASANALRATYAMYSKAELECMAVHLSEVWRCCLDTAFISVCCLGYPHDKTPQPLARGCLTPSAQACFPLCCHRSFIIRLRKGRYPPPSQLQEACQWPRSVVSSRR